MLGHPYGYPADAKFNIAVDDHIFAQAYMMDPDCPGPYRSLMRRRFGNAADAFQKVNDTMLKVTFKGTLGDGRIEDWFLALSLFPLPLHYLLDPF